MNHYTVKLHETFYVLDVTGVISKRLSDTEFWIGSVCGKGGVEEHPNHINFYGEGSEPRQTLWFKSEREMVKFKLAVS